MRIPSKLLCALSAVVLSILAFGAYSALAAAPEEPTTEAASAVTGTTATLNGVLYPGSEPEAGSTYEFLYKQTHEASKEECESPGASRAPASPGAVAGKAQAVSEPVTGLAENAVYVVCLATTNAEATPVRTVGEPVKFRTHAAAPTVGVESVAGVNEAEATVGAQVNPEGLETYVYVEYGTVEHPEQRTAPVAIGAEIAEKGVSVVLKHLEAGKSYKFHVVAFNAEGSGSGAEMSFLSNPPPFPHGESPWWHLLSLSRPTVIQPGTATSEVQELHVDATAGDVLVAEPVRVQEVIHGERSISELIDVTFPYNATSTEVQAALEGLYGAGSVQVTGGPQGLVGETEWAYTLTFRGALAGQPVPVYNTELGGLSGLRGTATISQTSEGKPDGTIVVTAADVGDAPANGAVAPVQLTDVLPPGLKPTSISARAPGDALNAFEPLACASVAQVQAGAAITCTYSKSVPAYGRIEMSIGVVVEHAEAGQENEASITGGLAPAAQVRHPLHIGDQPAPFGVEAYEMVNEEAGGSGDTQAGSHPFQTTFTTVLNTSAAGFKRAGEGGAEGPTAQVAALAKDLVYKLPAGWVGNPGPFERERCTLAQFYTGTCPTKSVVGVTSTTAYEPSQLGLIDAVVPLYDVEPDPGQAARFGFFPVSQPVFIGATVRAGQDDGVTSRVEDITQIAMFLANETTIWGVPGEPVHDAQRGLGCLDEARGLLPSELAGAHAAPCVPLDEEQPPAFLSIGTYCAVNPSTHEPEAMYSSLEADSWKEPGRLTAPVGASMPALDGCNKLPFNPSVRVSPDVQEASRPSGLTVDVHIPQEATLDANGLAEAEPRDITVTLPEGVAVNPSSGDGLQACSEHLVGYEGPGSIATDPGVSGLTFSPKLPGSVESEGLFDPDVLEPGVNFCPNASRIATAKIFTPLLPKPVEGDVYLASQNENPFGSLLAMYIVAEEPVSGVMVKLAGEVHLGPGGQLTTTFEDSPQAPFEDAELHFFGGERGPLATPSHCGTYTTTAAFTPWTAEPGQAPHIAESSFEINSGPHGTPCPAAALPFAPTLTGGSTNLNAGDFTPLTGTFSREDGEQNMARVSFTLPPGLSGILSQVTLCGEQQANEGKCGPESLVGETTVSAGVGSDPVSVTGGKVYITEKYHGAPFGLSIVDPVKAGPFDLEHDTANPNQDPPCDCIVVRAKIEINPYTSALTITSNSESEGYAIPHMIDGIPVQLKRINFITTRREFQFNPTNCSPMKIAGTVESDEGATKPVEVPFQATNCAVLKFTPTFTVSTSGKTSKTNGASLTAKVTEPAGSLGTQANLTRVKVELPKQLPSRLTTLQKACTAAQFAANPANCPAASKIGYAVVHTPLIPVPLQGPAIFVSHGGEAFPSLTMVLQGYGITIDLVGATFISESGITSTTFKTVPDQPFSSFELTLPQGPDSVLAANGNLCTEASQLIMPTEFIAQNGMEIDRNTKIGVTGCAKAKTRAQELAAALKACHNKHGKGKRLACEKQARRRYGTVKKHKK
jgi:hypothetical protein